MTSTRHHHWTQLFYFSPGFIYLMQILCVLIFFSSFWSTPLHLDSNLVPVSLVYDQIMSIYVNYFLRYFCLVSYLPDFIGYGNRLFEFNMWHKHLFKSFVTFIYLFYFCILRARLILHCY